VTRLSDNARLAAADFATVFVPAWYQHGRDPRGGVAEALDTSDRSVLDAAKTTLTQSRTVFTLAHLHLATGNTSLLRAAREVHAFLDASLRDTDGGYRFSEGAGENCRLRRAYDQSFALLALVTLRRADPQAVPRSRIEDLWAFIETVLVEPRTGGLWEDDRMAEEGPAEGAVRSQNPHMHMLEALLQAYEMSGERIWLERALPLLQIARDWLIDPATGAVREFVGPQLQPLESRDGVRREPGHQYEWAWLLHRYCDLSGDGAWRSAAGRMVAFAERHGRRPEGPMAGAVFDGVDSDGRPIEDTHLLWPLTEAGKFYAALSVQTSDRAAAAKACAIANIVFDRYFPAADSGRLHWVNRLDRAGRVIWPEALSRLLYHVALFVTEGARAGLWPVASSPHGERLILAHQEEKT